MVQCNTTKVLSQVLNYLLSKLNNVRQLTLVKDNTWYLDQEDEYGFGKKNLKPRFLILLMILTEMPEYLFHHAQMGCKHEFEPYQKTRNYERLRIVREENY